MSEVSIILLNNFAEISHKVAQYPFIEDALRLTNISLMGYNKGGYGHLFLTKKQGTAYRIMS